MSILIFLLITYVLLSFSLFKLFPKAGEEGWKGLVPGLNFITWCKIVGRPGWWAALLLIPIVNFFIYAGLCVDMVRSFGIYKFWDSFAAVVFAPLYFFKLATKPEDKYIGPTLKLEKEYSEKIKAAVESEDSYELKKLNSNNPYTKSAGREWAEAIIFAVFAAAFIRMFLIEAYVIPTSSMEGSLLVGDFLFVSKAHYGIRTPMTTAMVPLLHNRLPIIDRESYFKSPSLPYFRFGAFEEIDRNDPVVFNFPEGDSVYVCPGRTWSKNDFRFRRGNMTPGHVSLIKKKKVPLTVRPIDKKDHYIKRCVGIPGDSLQIIDRQVYINGKPSVNPENMQFLYTVNAERALNPSSLEDLGINIREGNSTNGYFFLNEKQVAAIKKMDPNAIIEDYPFRPPNPNHMFPQDSRNFPGWNVNNFGPVWIPKKGATIKLTADKIAPYKRVISIYENNDLKIENGKIFINGKETNEYTFKQNYYWMMGDNRHNSEDSRVWGYVPEDHIVGKPLFIWFSTKYGSIGNGIRWERIFSSASK